MTPLQFLCAAWALAVCLTIAWGVLAVRRRPRPGDFAVAPRMSLAAVDDRLASPVAGASQTNREKGVPLGRLALVPAARAAFETKDCSHEFLESMLSLAAILGDWTMITSGFVLANRLCRMNLSLAALGHIPMPDFSFNLILSGSLVMLWGLTDKDWYSYRSLVSPVKTWPKLLEGLGLCLAAFFVISQVVRSDSPIPWTFFVCSGITIFAGVGIWRLALGHLIRHQALSSRLRRRLVVIGAGSQTLRVQKSLEANPLFEFVGWVQALKPNHITELQKHRLGSLHELGGILQEHQIHIAVLTESESLQREGVMAVAKACENEHVEFKMVPHFFEILISGLRPEIIGGLPLLGVDSLPLSGFRTRVLKRAVDIIGALVGLALAVPLIVVFGTLVYCESPGPILYRQLRQGRNGRLFYILKIRSMQVNAESPGKAQWAKPNDQRRLKIGAFIRRWNIDEVPQFWNVLIGQMSLVGPRPERPELIARFKSRIPHYQARHKCRPGITGWAQINGWRGNTDLEERIRHDIWYLENWSLWLDFRIMLQTFFRRDNAY